MSSQIYLANKSNRPTQPPGLPRPKVTLSLEARRILLHGRRERSERFDKDLTDVWQKVNDATLNLASQHHKSVRRVRNELYLGYAKFCSKHEKPNAWNAFCWEKRRAAKIANENNPNALEVSKRDVLPDLVKNSKEEYAKLSADEKTRLVEEFNKFRESKTKGTRATARSKINDATHTISAIENELRSLRCRTGVETMLYATRGSTDVPLRGTAFATEGVQNFIGSVIGIDAHDLVSKMEGFAIQGIKGTAKNHQERVSQVRADIRHIMNRKLCEITGEDASMQWAHYFRNIVFRYKVIIEAWPPSIPIVNLSKASSSLGQLETLLRKWEGGSTHWRELRPGELELLRQERDHQLNNGEIEEPLRRTRSDKGTKRKRRAEKDPEVSRQQKKRKSAQVIHDSDDDEPTNEPASRGASPGDTGSSAEPAPGTPASAGTSDTSDPTPSTGSSASVGTSDTSGPTQSTGSSASVGTSDTSGPTPSTGSSASVGTSSQNNLVPSTGSSASIDTSNASGEITEDQSTDDLDLADLETSIFAFDGTSASLF
ncbi:hypothetical protein EV363DRAFT_1449797 [Boletus edulis]|nr:hypothetical protein EV363DRAFT_1449797 [Boletus edulis]